MRSDFLRENREAVRGFLADYVIGLSWLYDPRNRAKALQLTSELTKTSAEQLDSYFMTARDYYHDPLACISASMIQRPIDAMLQEKLIDRHIKADEYVDLSLLPQPCLK